MSPCDALPIGHREICAGETAHTPKKRHAYLQLWLREGKIDRLPHGYEFTPATDPPKPKKSRGLGDTVAKITKATGIDKVAKAFEKVTGKPCGCTERQEKLNRFLPYQ